MNELDELERDMDRRRRRKKLVVAAIFGAFFLAGAIPCALVTFWMGEDVADRAEYREEHSQEPTLAQITSVLEAAQATESQFETRAARWREAMAPAIDYRPAPEAGPCPFELPVRQPAEAARGGSFNNLDSFDSIAIPGRQSFPYATVPVASEAVPDDPPRVVWAQDRAARVRERIRDRGTVEQIARVVSDAESLASDAYWTYDVLVFFSVMERPRADPTGTSFEQGLAGGTAIVYDYQANEIACAGNFIAETTSESVEYRSQVFNESYTLQHMLDAEFDAEIERAVARAVQDRAVLADSADASVPGARDEAAAP